jgi:hypothetical protein
VGVAFGYSTSSRLEDWFAFFFLVAECLLLGCGRNGFFVTPMPLILIVEVAHVRFTKRFHNRKALNVVFSGADSSRCRTQKMTSQNIQGLDEAAGKWR